MEEAQKGVKAPHEVLIKNVQNKYEVRSFRTTTESLIFTKKISLIMSSMKDVLKDMGNIEVSNAFEFFDPELIKYVVETFVMRKTASGLVEVDYEKDFINDFPTIFALFLMAIKHLSIKANGGKKPQAVKIKGSKKTNKTEMIKSAKR